MSIRGRLLALAIGGVVPLLIAGLTVLWVVWSGKQQQINESLEQQAELAAVVFDHWLGAQYQPLITIASYPLNHLNDRSALEENLKAALINRKHWIDVRVLDASGRVVATYPAGAEDLPAGVADKLLSEVSRGVPDVETDWTRGEGRYILALAVPLEGGGAVIARVDGEALKEPLPHQGQTLPARAVITLLDQRHRVIYRSQTPESTIGLDLTDSGVVSALQNQSTAVVHVRSSIDGVERVYGLARVAATGYVVMVGVPSAVLYAAAWRQLTGYVLVGL
jgi:hypothetical protein